MEKILYVIPAKACSKRLPNKNFLYANNAPMVYRSITAAINSEFHKDIVVITSSEDWSESLSTLSIFACKTGGIVEWRSKLHDLLFMPRPMWLSEDPAQVDDVVSQVKYSFFYNYYNFVNTSMFDTLCIVQPDCPMVTATHVDNALRLHEKYGKPIVAASKCIGEVMNGHSPFVYSMIDGPVYQRSGMLFICKSAMWDACGSKQGVVDAFGAYVYEIPWVDSLEVHTQADLNLANILLREKEL